MQNSSNEPKQRICNRTPSTLGLCTKRGFAGSLDKQFAGCLEKSPKTNNNKHKYLSVATPSSTSLIRSALRHPALSDADASGTSSNDLQSFLSMHGADLQAALDKDWDNVLHLLRTGTTAGQNMIPKKLLPKVCKANMTTMTQINTLIARAGGKELSTRSLKGLGSIDKHAAMELYNAKVAEQNAMEQEPPADIDAPVISDIMIAGQDSTVTDLQRSDNFWQSHLPNRCHILSMEPDGNCFFRCILDQLNHDNGAGHDFARHQLTDHIRRHDDKFKNFLLLGNDHKDITDLKNYIHNMGQNSTWGGCPEVYAAAWFYDIDITIYSPEYTNTGGFLVFKVGGPNGTCYTPNSMWNILYHGNNHFNSIRSPKNPPRPSQDKSDMDRYQAYMQNALDGYQDNFAKLAFLSCNNGTPIPPHDIKPIRVTTGSIMLYIAAHLLATGGAPISELQMKILLDQAEKCAMEFVQANSVQPSLKSTQAPDLLSPTQAAIPRYTPCNHQ
jgi:hypothetical protein